MGKDKTYYYKQLKILEEVAKKNKKPKLLLHVCCGPCSTAVLDTIYQHFDITIYYTNSNIYPETEYNRRLNELKLFIPNFNLNCQTNIKIIEKPYQMENYHKLLENLKDQKEGGSRCHLCYFLRLKDTFEYATIHNFDYVSTALTLSRMKNSKKINEIAQTISSDFPNIIYFYSDFKKNKGIDKSITMTNLYNMYRQDYCGCLYSYQNKKT